MPSNSPEVSTFLHPPWNRVPIPSWLLSLLVLAILAAARYYAVLGPPRARILFPLHILVMWALPFIFLSTHGRSHIGLHKPANAASALALSALAGAACGLAIFIFGIAFYANSPNNWDLSIRNSFQIDQLRRLLPPTAVLAVMVLPAMILTPVGEEILFRGLIQQSFALRWNAFAGILANGVAFGLIHLHVHGLWHDATGFHFRLVSGALVVLLLSAASAVFTLCRLRFGSLYAAMVAHAACNLAIIAAVFFHYT